MDLALLALEGFWFYITPQTHSFIMIRQYVVESLGKARKMDGDAH